MKIFMPLVSIETTEKPVVRVGESFCFVDVLEHEEPFSGCLSFASVEAAREFALQIVEQCELLSEKGGGK